MDLSKVHVGGIIKQIATQKGLSTYQLQEMAHMSNQAIGKIYKKDSIQTDLLHRFSKALGVNLYDVVSYFATEPEPAQDFLAAIEKRKAAITIDGLSEPMMRLTIDVPEHKQKEVLEMVKDTTDGGTSGGTK